MFGGPEPKGAPHALTDEDRAREQDSFGLEERERRAVLAWVGKTFRTYGGPFLGSDSFTWSSRSVSRAA